MSRTPRPSPAVTMQVTTKSWTATLDMLSTNSFTIGDWLRHHDVTKHWMLMVAVVVQSDCLNLLLFPLCMVFAYGLNDRRPVGQNLRDLEVRGTDQRDIGSEHLVVRPFEQAVPEMTG